ncbi:MAG: type II toxin-antitoxin system RelE/ParE family toxin [Clostridiales bacterium]|nr:type II toxin-antitoxin system RelE/ParE family toxin [Clostridiales bacterium]
MKRKYKIVYSPKSIDDLRSIYMYICNVLEADGTAKKQISRIRDCIKRLDTLPERHEVVEWEPWSLIGMRKFPVDNYIVFYLVNRTDKVVTIVRILYGGQDINRQLDQ